MRFILTALIFLWTCIYVSAQNLENCDSICVQTDSIVSSPAFSGQNNRQSVGLVLSGGGAKGIAHVGIIKALEDNDIPIDYVTGTSMGAIVGSLYSCGWSPERMMELFTSSDFDDWSSGVINKKYIYYYDQPRPTPQWGSINVNFGKDSSISSQIIPTSLISPLPMNIEFLKIYGPYSQQCKENFNNLFVPFRCVASDVYHKHKVVFSEGSLGDAVRASMSFPMVFRPIEVNGILLYDGGIYDNFPVNVMQEDFNPDFIIGVSVSGADSKPIQGDMYSQLEDMIIQNNDYTVPSKNGIKIQVPVLNFGVLDFGQARQIYEIGYKTGLEMVDSIKSRISAREPLTVVNQRRAQFAAHTPQLIFDKVDVKGLDKSEAGYLKYLFTGNSDEPFGIDRTINSYFRAVTDGSLSNLIPQLEFGKNGQDTLVLYATPRRPWTFGVGGFLTTSTNSMLYFSGSYHTMGYNSLDVSLDAWLGQAYFAGMLNTKFSMRTNMPSYMELMAVLSKQKFYEKEELFFKSSNPMFTTEVDNFLRVGYVWAMGKRAKGFVNFGAGYVSDSYYDTNLNDENEGRNLMQYWIIALRGGYDKNTLNHHMFPSEGQQLLAEILLSYQYSRFHSSEGYLTGNGWKKSPVGSLEILWKQYFNASKYFSIGAMGNLFSTFQRLNQNYTNTLVHSHSFAPTPSTQNYFNLAFRSDNYAAIGLIPVWMPAKRLQVRGDFYGYFPMRRLVDNGYDKVASYDGWFRDPQFIGEVSVIYNLPFASISVYGNYLSSPRHNWNFGISFGLLFRAPKLLGR